MNSHWIITFCHILTSRRRGSASRSAMRSFLTLTASTRFTAFLKSALGRAWGLLNDSHYRNPDGAGRRDHRAQSASPQQTGVPRADHQHCSPRPQKADHGEPARDRAGLRPGLWTGTAGSFHRLGAKRDPGDCHRSVPRRLLCDEPGREPGSPPPGLARADARNRRPQGTRVQQCRNRREDRLHRRLHRRDLLSARTRGGASPRRRRTWCDAGQYRNGDCPRPRRRYPAGGSPRLTRTNCYRGTKSWPFGGIILQRNQRRKSLPRTGRGVPNTGKITAAALIQSYETEAQRQKLLVKKADLAQTRLTFIVNALRRLYVDEEFLTLLRAEAMHTLPRPLAEQLELSEA